MNSSPSFSDSDRRTELAGLLASLHGVGPIAWLAPDEAVATLLREQGVGVESVSAAALHPQPGAETLRTRWASGTCPAVWVGPAVSELGIGSLDAVVAEALRIAGGVVGLVVPMECGRTAADWDERLFARNFRSHPARCSPVVNRLQPLLAPQDFAVLLYQRIPASAAEAEPFAGAQAQRLSPPDWLRETGRSAIARQPRYAVARESVRPGMQVLEVGCGRGCGAAMLRLDPSVAFTGVDRDRAAVEYALRHYASPGGGTRFLRGSIEHLAFAESATFDLVTSFDTLESVIDPEAFLAELHRVLKPGGRLILSSANQWLDGQGRNPVPAHLHVLGFSQLSRLLQRGFRVEHLYRQNAGGDWKRVQDDRFERVEGRQPDAAAQADAEWWVVVAMREEVSAVPPSSVTPGASIDRPLRVALLDEPERHRELFGQALDQLNAQRLDARTLSPEALVAAAPDVLLLSREWTPDWRLAAAACGRAGIPVVYVMDGVLEWSYVWNNLSHIRPQGAMLQPLMADHLCAIGRHPARILATLGLGPRLHVVGLPRLDAYPRTRHIEAGTPPRVLIATARTAGHDPEQQLMARRALRDLKGFFDTVPAFQPVWRIAADLAEDIGVRPDISGSFSSALEAASALITFPSTCVLEAMLKGVPVAQIEYRAVPLYVSAAWEIRSPEMIPSVVQELLHPPAEKLAWQNACLGDEVESGNASERLVAVIRQAVERGAAGEVSVADTDGPLDFRQVHSELSAFAAAPLARVQYELDAAHRLLKEARQQRNRGLGQAAELVESAFGRDITELRVYSLVDQLASATIRTERYGSVSAGPATLAGRTSRTLFLGAPARATWRLPVGTEGTLAFAIAIHPDAWTNPESGACAFRVRINRTTVLEVVIDVHAEPGDRKWHWFSLPVTALPAADAGCHEVELAADGVGGEAFRWTLWRNPQFFWSDSESDPTGSWTPGAARLPDYYVAGRTVV